MERTVKEHLDKERFKKKKKKTLQKILGKRTLKRRFGKKMLQKTFQKVHFKKDTWNFFEKMNVFQNSTRNF